MAHTRGNEAAGDRTSWTGTGRATAAAILTALSLTTPFAEQAAGSTDDYPASTATTGTVTVGGSLTGEIEHKNDRDWIGVDLTSGTTYRIDVEKTPPGDLDPKLYGIRNASGDVIAGTENDNDGVRHDALLLFTSTTTGTHYLDIGVGTAAPTFYGTGEYTIRVKTVTDDYSSDTSTTASVTVDGSASGEIETDGDRDWFAVDLTTGIQYRVDLRGGYDGDGKLGDPYLYGIHDANGDVIANTTNDNRSGGGRSAQVFFTPTATAGHYIAAGGATNTNTLVTRLGTYTLEVTTVEADDFADDTTTTGAVTVGSSTTGKLETPEDRDWFAVDLIAGVAYQIDLKGTATGDGTLRDPRLAGVHDADGNLIENTTDDNSGQSVNARVVFTAETTAKHYIAARGSRRGSLGTYTLAVTEQTPSMQVKDASATEGEGLGFEVVLDSASSTTITVSYATADGAATAGTNYTAASGTLTFATGDTSKSVTVATTDDTTAGGDKTLTLSLSNASGAQIADAEATGTIVDDEEPASYLLTASFSRMPAEHGGARKRFTFDLTFSENIKVSFRTLRDRAFNVGGGTVRRAKRKTQGSNVAWTITVEPSSSAAVTIELPKTSDCDASGALCTHDGEALSQALSATVAGPAGLSVADARAEENVDDTIDFTVSLDRSASGRVRVEYATSDGTATAGTDYTAASGTLTFQPGQQSKTIEIALIDDSHDEDDETFNLTLSNAAGAIITDGSATGTIENEDALPRALLARFGRTAAVHVVEQVEERVNAPRAPGFDGRVAGRQINSGMGRDFARDFLQQLGAGAGAMTAAGGSAPPVGNGGLTSSLGPRNTAGRPMNAGGMHGLHPAGTAYGNVAMDLDGERLMGGSAFAVNRATSSGGVLSFWSRSASS